MNEKETLFKNNFKFSKKYGQNFIFDKNLLKAIINDSKISASDDVLEIGPGAGTLTKVIAQTAKKVVCYEIDTSLENVLKENLRDFNNVNVVFKDALKESIENIEKHFDGKYKIVANLPYYITTPLIFKFVKQTKRVESMCIMVQKEVGERLTAKAGHAEFGAISVVLDFYGNVKILRQVPRHLFVPSPNVDSCIVQIDFVNNKYCANEEMFEKVVRLAFSNRRKTLVNNLCKEFNMSKELLGKILQENGYSATIRGDSLTTDDFVKITNLLS